MAQPALRLLPVLDPAEIRVALTGNPNCGKTSLFNALTGARQHVGNYPGVTVEKRWGSRLHGGRRLRIEDLPGTYSLVSYSPEERIAQQELARGDHDVVVVVVDSNTLKRSLVLLSQIMQTGASPVLCLNMSDEAERNGLRLDLPQMQRLLGFPVVQTVGHRGLGVESLLEAIEAAARGPASEPRLVLGERLQTALAPIRALLTGTAQPPQSLGWAATRLLVGDQHLEEQLRREGSRGQDAIDEARRQRQRLEQDTGQDAALFVAEQHFGFVDGLLREVVLARPRANARMVSDAIDQVLVHRVLGLPVFAAVMYAIFWTTFRLGEIPMRWIEAGFRALGEVVSTHWPVGSASLLRSLVVDGIIAGVGGVVVFLPNILLLFFGLALLEDTGYMARAAFLMDKLMHRFGLHGKSFVPMMSGFGCSVPGIMATRTLDNERDRLTTMLVLPLMSCGARLPIWMLLIPAFFPPAWRAPMLWLIYGIGIALALVLALVLRKSVLAGDDAPFVMELPPYRLPTLRAMVSRMAERAWIYLRKAATVLLGISVLMWASSTFPKKPHYDVDQAVASGAEHLSVKEVEAARAAEALRYSVAGRVGVAVEPVLAPLGFDWKMATGMIGAFAAKEVFVAQMGIVFSLGDTDEHCTALRSRLAASYPPLVGFSLMLFLLIGTPCMATFAVTRRESGSSKWAALQFFGLTGVAYLAALLVYQLGSWLL